MVEKFKGQYRIDSARWAKWDYGSNAPYFVTICTKNLVHYFGTIKNGKIQYSDLGQQANQCWLDIPAHFPFVKLDLFVVMPNHVHGIIVIDKPEAELKKWTTNRFGPQARNLGSIVRGFKIGVTKASHQLNPLFEWQSRYHDHVIRNHESLERIRHYIQTNIENWGKDKFY